MALGLSASCIGNNEQRLVYDDLGLPEFGVAEGENSANYYWKVSRNVNWRMSNEYLRKYLWMRGALGVCSFYYSAVLPDTPELVALMADRCVVDRGRVAGTDRAEEHVAAKTKRLLDQILDLGDRLAKLSEAVGVPKEAAELVGFSRAEIEANWWTAYPQLCRLAQVAPLSMTQQAFLARCKSLHKVWQRVRDGFMRGGFLALAAELACDGRCGVNGRWRVHARHFVGR